MVISFSTSNSRFPFGVTTVATSPTFLPSSARPIGEIVVRQQPRLRARYLHGPRGIVVATAQNRGPPPA